MTGIQEQVDKVTDALLVNMTPAALLQLFMQAKGVVSPKKHTQLFFKVKRVLWLKKGIKVT